MRLSALCWQLIGLCRKTALRGCFFCRAYKTAIRVGVGLFVVKAYAESDATLTNKTGIVDYTRANEETSVQLQGNWLPLQAKDRLRTHEDSTAVVLTRRNWTVVKLNELSSLEILPAQYDRSPWAKLWDGALYFFSRDQSREIMVQTPHMTAAPHGTEFLLSVTNNQTLLAVFDGSATLTNRFGGTNLQSGEVGIATFDSAPARIALSATNIVQWWLYYPAVLDVDEFHFETAERKNLEDSISHYRRGDLRAALVAYRGYPHPEHDRLGPEASRIYLAGLYLAVGQPQKTQELLKSVETNTMTAALYWLIAAVQNRTNAVPELHTSASEWLGLSYYYQARHELRNALDAAKQATALSPNFGFAWERRAELEFGFGKTDQALEDLERSLKLAPSNAQAHALKGFLLSARGDRKQALESFDNAIHLDPNLGNAWLGRGLARIRNGAEADGRSDLQMAALLEPNRSVLRSYLGKALSDAGEYNLANLEFDRAKMLDPKDPTPWLYGALLKNEQNLFNQGIQDLETSQALSDNRRLYRSRFLLDEDRAVRSVSLANLYEHAGMTDVSVREAARGVDSDYANYSAHLFLSDSYDTIRDPTRFNLRYETPWFNELLLANLLSPVGGTPLSQHISQQEYSRFFEQDRIGLLSSTENRSDSQFHQLASQYGNIGNTGWSLDLDYQHNDGIRGNNDLDRIEWYSTIKQQLTPDDSLLFLIKYQDYHSGDNFQYFDPTNASQHFRFDEYQQPIAIGGYHHEWQPGFNTLLLGGRLENEQHFSDIAAPVHIIEVHTNPFPRVDLGADNLDFLLQSKSEIYFAEAQQILETKDQRLIVGGRWQGGQFDSASLQDNPVTFNWTNRNNVGAFGAFPSNGVPTDVTADFAWLSGYVYETLKLPTRLNLTAGVAYEHEEFPVNFRAPPLQSGTTTRNQWSPKAAVVWQIRPEMTLRGIYSRSLGGVSLDESYRLEPTQLGGFPQSFRTIISESLVGSVSAPVHEVAGGGLDLNLPSRTYIGLQGEILSSKVRQTVGFFQNITTDPFPNISPIPVEQHLDYHESDFRFSLNQLISDEWSLGLSYYFTHSELKTTYPVVSRELTQDQINTKDRAELHQISPSVLYNHSSGLFARLSFDWYLQTSLVGSDLPVDVPEQTFNQLNLFLGYRFPRQRGDFTIGMMNLLDENYHFSPVTPHEEFPRKHVVYVRFRFRI